MAMDPLRSREGLQRLAEERVAPKRGLVAKEVMRAGGEEAKRRAREEAVRGGEESPEFTLPVWNSSKKSGR